MFDDIFSALILIQTRDVLYLIIPLFNKVHLNILLKECSARQKSSNIRVGKARYSSKDIFLISSELFVGFLVSIFDFLV